MVGPVEPGPERLDIGGLDRGAAPDADAGRSVAIAGDVIGRLLGFEQRCDLLDERELGCLIETFDRMIRVFKADAGVPSRRGIDRADANAAALDAWVQKTDWIEHLAVDPATRSNTSVCLKFADHAVEGLDDEGKLALVKRIAALLEAEDAAYDVAGYRDAPPGIRIWCGATVETADIEALGPWLDWAWEVTA